MCVYIYIYLCIYTHTCIYIYIYRERERDRHTHTHTHTHYIRIYIEVAQFTRWADRGGNSWNGKGCLNTFKKRHTHAQHFCTNPNITITVCHALHVSTLAQYSTVLLSLA